MSFVKSDWGKGSDSDSECILPDFPSINEQPNQNDESRSKILPGRSSVENFDAYPLDVIIKEEKVEVSESFFRRSIDEENDQATFPTGHILFQNQRTMTATASDNLTQAHLLSNIPVLNDEKESPNYFQVPAPKSSIIQTKNSEIQFMRQASQAKPSKRTRFPARPLPPSDPLAISPRGRTSFSSKSILPVESKFKGMETTKMRIERKRRQKAENARKARERIRQSETPEERKIRLAADVERQRNRLAKETDEQRETRLGVTAERNRQYLANETLEERMARLAGYAERHRNSLAHESPEQRDARLGALAEQRRKLFNEETPEQRNARLTRAGDYQRQRLANETPEEKAKRLADALERQRNRMANETPEQKEARLAAGRERRKKRLANKTPEQSTTSDLVPCEYCEKSLTPRRLRGHIIREHLNAEDKQFKCDHCEKRFATQKDCKAHMLTHSNEKRFICDKCGKEYKGKSGLKKHIISKHRFDEDVQEKYWRE